MLKKTLYLLGLLFIGSFTSAVQISLEPQFSDPRFQPADKLHAGCTHTANVQIKTSSKENISSFRFVISYEPQKLEILEIKPNEKYKGTLDSKIEYDKIIISMLNKPIPKNETTPLFSISFKSNAYASGTSLVLHKPSYVVNQNNEEVLVFAEQKLVFATVAECEPDIVPPTISLVKPQNTSQLLKMDNTFVFLLKDAGKGIDKDSISIDFDGNKYSGTDSAFMWSGDEVIFYPKTWIPAGKKLDLSLSINDKQAYGGANTITKTFAFVSHSGVVFENGVTPSIYRNLLGNIKTLSATPEECNALAFLEMNSSVSNFSTTPLENLSKKINCPFDVDLIGSSIKNKQEVKQGLFLSVFALLGWVLFGIAFILKLHYLVSYRKHKKIATSLQASESKSQTNPLP